MTSPVIEGPRALVFLVAEQEVVADRVTGSPAAGGDRDEEAPKGLAMLRTSAM
jgi:hypothetical protein